MRRASLVVATLTGLAMTVSAPVALSAPAADPPTAPDVPAADEPAGSADAALVEQRPLVDAATIVRSAVDASGVDGLASIVLDDSSVSVWWKGGRAELPADVAAAIDEAGAIAPVEVADAEYSRTDLVEASATLESDLESDPDFVGINAAPDGSGLDVKVDVAAASGEAAALSAVDVPNVGVPTTVVEVERPTDISRPDDAAPWSGGATVVNRTIGAGCTAGFGVDTPSGPAIIIAGHCGNTGDKATDGDGESIGSFGSVDKNLDIAVIPTTEVSDKIYIGDENSNETLTVTDAGAPFVGEILCQSGNTSAGATGGPVCNMEVKAEGSDSQKLWEARQLDGQTSARGGDSGGPVYSDRGDGTVIARGTSTWTAGSKFGFGGFDKYEAEYGVSLPGGVGPDDPEPPTYPTPPAAGASGPISSALEDRCMDVAFSGTEDGTPVHSWDCNGTDAQEWTLNSDGSLQALGMCLTPAGGGTAAGTVLQVFGCDGSDGQQWSYVADSESWKNTASGRCIDYPNGSRDRGLQLQISDCDGGVSQRASAPGA